VGACGVGRDLVELGEFLAGAGEADLQAVDFAEPALLAGFGDAGEQVVADLDQPLAVLHRSDEVLALAPAVRPDRHIIEAATADHGHVRG